MGTGDVKGPAIGTHLDGTKHWWSCPRCGEQNPSESTKCRDCLTPLLQKEATVNPSTPIALEKVTRSERKVVNPMARKLVAPPAPHKDAMTDPPKVVRRRVIRKKVAASSKSASKLDLLRRTIDAFTRMKEVELLQCSVCGDVVDESIAVCTCGAIFEDAAGQPWGYECPMCGRRVASDSIECRCGARFAH